MTKRGHRSEILRRERDLERVFISLLGIEPLVAIKEVFSSLLGLDDDLVEVPSLAEPRRVVVSDSNTLDDSNVLGLDKEDVDLSLLKVAL